MSNKRIFVSFAIEDVDLRNLFLEQAKYEAPNFEFFSIKEPWILDWKNKYRATISDFDGLIFIVTSNTKNADGQLWEIKCTKEMSIPIYGIWSGTDDYTINISEDLNDIQIKGWNWNNIIIWLNSL